MNVSSADEFYTLMGDLTQEMVDNRMLNPDSMLKVTIMCLMLLNAKY